MGKFICDCGAHYSSSAAVESCQIGNHGRLKPHPVDCLPLVDCPCCGERVAKASLQLSLNDPEPKTVLVRECPTCTPDGGFSQDL